MASGLVTSPEQAKNSLIICSSEHLWYTAKVIVREDPDLSSGPRDRKVQERQSPTPSDALVGRIGSQAREAGNEDSVELESGKILGGAYD